LEFTDELKDKLVKRLKAADNQSNICKHTAPRLRSYIYRNGYGIVNQITSADASVHNADTSSTPQNEC